MYAIVEIAGQQFKVEKDQKVFVHRLQTEEGKKISFENVLLVSDGNKVSIGAPAIDGAHIGVKVLKHFKADKVIVFKKKRRKGYRVKNGHRQALTEIMIENISNSGAKKTKPTEKVEKTVKVDKKAENILVEKQDLSKLTVAALKLIAKEKGLTGISSMKKDDLVKALS